MKNYAIKISALVLALLLVLAGCGLPPAEKAVVGTYVIDHVQQGSASYSAENFGMPDDSAIVLNEDGSGSFNGSAITWSVETQGTVLITQIGSTFSLSYDDEYLYLNFVNNGNRCYAVHTRQDA